MDDDGGTVVKEFRCPILPRQRKRNPAGRVARIAHLDDNENDDDYQEQQQRRRHTNNHVGDSKTTPTSCNCCTWGNDDTSRRARTTYSTSGAGLRWLCWEARCFASLSK